MNEKNNKKNAPKLPRFKCPKSMTSKTYASKRDKSRTRKNLNRFWLTNI